MADLAAAEDEVAWFARVLIPELRQSGSAEQVAGGWAVGSSRVSAVEDRLTALEASLRMTPVALARGPCVTPCERLTLARRNWSHPRPPTRCPRIWTRWATELEAALGAANAME